MLPEDLYLKWDDKVDATTSAKTDAVRGEQYPVSTEVSNSCKHFTSID
jgi:hypothetical protein